MKRLLTKSTLVFCVDLVVSTLSSAAAILLFRFYASAIPEYIHLFLLWVAVAVVSSAIAISLSKIHRILFSYAQFKTVANIFLFGFIKELLQAITFVFIDTVLNDQLMLICFVDFTFSIVAIAGIKVLILQLIEEGNEDRQEKIIDKLNVVVYGTSSKSISVVTRYEQSEHYIIKGFITRDKDLEGSIIMGFPVYCLTGSVSNHQLPDVEAVLFAVHDEFRSESAWVEELDKKGICVLNLPSVQITNYPGLELKEIKHTLESHFIPDHMSGFGRATKRTIDFTIASILLIVFSPLMLGIYLILWMSEGTPVIFKQERIGRFGRPFNILKFRTMRLDAEAAGPALYSGDDDPRLTKVGKFLRLHHLDELPQLFNVFVGDMSFVGYRPERKVYIDKIVEKDPRYAYLYQIRPGVTSYATLRNGYTDTLEKMLRRLKFDLYYLNHRSLFFDLKILWDTFINITFGKKF